MSNNPDRNNTNRENRAMNTENNVSISFDDYKKSWLEDITEGDPSPLEKGHRFAKKLIMEWTEYTDASDDDITFCDGKGDGGIDVAYLQRGDRSEDSEEGDVWYIIQSKFGTSFQGKDTILIESQKVIDTIDGKNSHISSSATDVVEALKGFRSKAGERDRMVLVFATVDPFTEEERNVLEDIRTLGIAKFGGLFSVENVSVKTIFDRNETQLQQKITIPFFANLAPSGRDLLVGSVKLIDLYSFLKLYQKATSDLDLLYEKNVRRFLGANKKVNKGIAATLRVCPERFGLFNNGITIVVEEFSQNDGNKYDLIEPFIVNGCQTTRTIWEVLEKKLASGGTGKEPQDFIDWQEQLKQGIVVVKVVQVGDSGEDLLNETTEYTNSQNAVSAKDFLALKGNFKQWAIQMENKYGIFLEIQRGGWESRKALQKKSPNIKQVTDSINAFELIKVYASAWLNEPGQAFGKNPPFVPGGKLYTQITNDQDFGIEDFFAAYCLYSTAKRSNATKPTGKVKRSRYLFYYVVVELLRKVLRSSTGSNPSHTDITSSIIKLFDVRNKTRCEAARLLLEEATLLDDDYFNQNNEDCIFTEPTFKGDLNTHLKTYNVSKSHAPKLCELLDSYFKDLRKLKKGEEQSAHDIITAALGIK